MVISSVLENMFKPNSDAAADKGISLMFPLRFAFLQPPLLRFTGSQCCIVCEIDTKKIEINESGIINVSRANTRQMMVFHVLS